MKEEKEHKKLSDIQKEKFSKGLKQAPKIWEALGVDKKEEQIGDLVVQEKEALTGRLKLDIKNLPYEYIELYHDIKAMYQYDRNAFINLLKVFVKYKADEMIEHYKEKIEKIKRIKDILTTE